MIYLISHLSVWLFLTAAFAAIAGWAFAAERNAAAENATRRERDNLMRDLIRLASGEAQPHDDALESEREADAARRMVQLRDGRIAELEQSLEAARARANDASGQLAELQRQIERGGVDTTEINRLRAQVAAHEAREAQTVDVEAQPADAGPDDSEALATLQNWRLRYFEQRVKYLEGLAHAAVPLADATPDAEAQVVLPLQWRAREAEARVAYLEQALREPAVAPATPAEAEPAIEESAFAADADVDVLLRWRLLYLERRVAHLQARAAAQEQVTPAPALEAPAEARPDPDRWKWRARYLEARVRHLEQRTAEAPRAAQAARSPEEPIVEEVPPPPPASAMRRKPPVLAAARNGAPDDLTLIDEISLLQQTTLNALGVFHYDQIAAWTPEHVAWIDNYLRLRGRIDDEEWVEQADELAREGPAAARRTLAAE